MPVDNKKEAKPVVTLDKKENQQLLKNFKPIDLKSLQSLSEEKENEVLDARIKELKGMLEKK